MMLFLLFLLFVFENVSAATLTEKERAIKARYDKTRKGVLGRFKTKLGISEAAIVCKPKTYTSRSEAIDDLNNIEKYCSVSEHNKALAHFCVHQCYRGKKKKRTCMPKCGTICNSWLESSAAGAKTRDENVTREGVVACASEESEEDVAFSPQNYDYFRDRVLEKGSRKIFVRGEKACQKAGKMWSTSVVKACVLFKKLRAAVSAMNTSKRFISKKREGVSAEDVMRGLLERADQEAMRLVETKWAAKLDLSYKDLEGICAEIPDVDLEKISAEISEDEDEEGDTTDGGDAEDDDEEDEE